MKQKLPNGFAQKAFAALKHAAPTILSCVGAVGVVVTTVLTVKATPKAMQQIEEAKTVKMAEKGENLTRMETIAACWTTYVPVAIAGIATIGFIFGANVLNKRQQASILAAYAFLGKSYRDYQQATKKIFGEEGHQKVMQELMVEQAKSPPIYSSLWGETFDFGETTDERHMFYDTLSERYFDASFADVLLAELHTNRNFAIGGEVPLQSFYEFLGLDTPEELMPLRWYVCDYYYFIDFTHNKTFVDDGYSNEPVECWIIDMPFPPTLEPIED